MGWSWPVLVVAGFVLVACAQSGQPEVASAPPADATSTVPSSSVSTVPSTTEASASPATPPSLAYDICASTRHVTGGSYSTSSAFEVLETYDRDFGDEWAGWTFDGSAEEPAFRVFVTDRPEFHSAELASRLTEPVPIEVEVVDRARRELEPLADRLRVELAPDENLFGRRVFAAVSRNRNTGLGQTRVWVVVERIDDQILAEVESLLGGDDPSQVCLAPRIGPIRATGEQAQAGPGWRLLDETKRGPVALEVATTVDAYRALWIEAGSGTAVPSVDFDREVVVYAGSGTGGCTDLYLTGVDFGPGPTDDTDSGSSTLTMVVDRPSCGTGGELAILIPHGYLLAVDRDRLADRVELQVDARRGASQPDPVTVHLDDRVSETDRLGDPRIEVTLVPPVEGERAWSIIARSTGPAGALLFTDAFEVPPPGVLGDEDARSREELIAELLAPRRRSLTVPAEVDGLTVEVQSCVDDVCTEPRSCEVELGPLTPYDHLRVELRLLTDGACRFGTVEPVT